MKTCNETELAIDKKCNILSREEDPLLNRLESLIRFAVKMLAILMTFVIFWGIFDVIWMLYQRMTEPPVFLLSIHDILATFGAFMAVLIAIEIFVNITMYLRDNVIHVRIVVATALMAAARKVIVLDMASMSAMHIGLGDAPVSYIPVKIADNVAKVGAELVASWFISQNDALYSLV